MIIGIANDHHGIDVKGKIINYFDEKKISYINYGADYKDNVDYVDYALKLCEEINLGNVDLGILICGTGIGMSIAANKHKGIRAACCSDTFSAKLTREHNDAIVLCFGERVVGAGLATELVDAFIDAGYLNSGNHVVRVAMLDELDNKR